MFRTIRVFLWQFIREAIGILSSKVDIAMIRSSPAANQAYERKAANDFRITTRVKLKKSERLTPAALRCLDGCKTVDEAIEKLKTFSSIEEYVIRIAYIWHYYKIINNDIQYQSIN